MTAPLLTLMPPLTWPAEKDLRGGERAGGIPPCSPPGHPPLPSPLSSLQPRSSFLAGKYPRFGEGLPASVHLVSLREVGGERGGGGREREGQGEERLLLVQFRHLGMENDGGGRGVGFDVDVEGWLARWVEEGWRVRRVNGRTLTGLYADERLEKRGREVCRVRWEGDGEGRGLHVWMAQGGFCTVEVGMEGSAEARKEDVVREEMERDPEGG